MIDIEEKSPGFLILEIASIVGFIIIYASTVFSDLKTSLKISIEAIFFLLFPLFVFILGWIEWTNWTNPIMIIYTAFLASILLIQSESTLKTMKERLFNAVVTSSLFTLSLVCIKNDGNTQLDTTDRFWIYVVGYISLFFFFLTIIVIRAIQERRKWREGKSKVLM